jgi:hypothetical protein
MSAFATVEDIELLGGKTLSASERARAAALLPVMSNVLRNAAEKVGKDLDAMAAASATYADTVRMVTVDVTIRALRQDVEGAPMTQITQSGLGYSVSGTYSIPGGGISNCIMNNDLKRLGLKQQKIGALDVYGIDDDQG